MTTASRCGSTFIGHVLYEGETYECIRNQGDFFRGAQLMHFSGCDQLGDSTWPTPARGSLNNLVGPKLASSAAHHFVKPRVMCECFGCGSNWYVDLRTAQVPHGLARRDGREYA